MNNAALTRMKRRVAQMNARFTGVPDIAELAQDQDNYEAERERRAQVVGARVDETIVIDPIEDESLDGGWMTCLVCGLSSDHDSMGAAGAAGWHHAQECGGQR